MSLDNALWFVSFVAEAAMVALLLYRRVWRTLPVFCLFCAWEVLSDAGLYTIAHHFRPIYPTTYLVSAALDSALQFCVLVELVWSVLRPIRASLPRGVLFAIAVLILAVGAAIWPFSGLPGLASQPMAWRNIVHLQQTASILRILFFLVMAGCSQLLSIGWRDRELQVVTGLGVYSFVSLGVAMLRMQPALWLQYHLLDQVVVASYFLSLTYWVFSFATKEAERREFTPQMQNFLLAVAGAARSTRMSLTDSDDVKSRDRRD